MWTLLGLRFTSFHYRLLYSTVIIKYLTLSVVSIANGLCKELKGSHGTLNALFRNGISHESKFASTVRHTTGFFHDLHRLLRRYARYVHVNHVVFAHYGGASRTFLYKVTSGFSRLLQSLYRFVRYLGSLYARLTSFYYNVHEVAYRLSSLVHGRHGTTSYFPYTYHFGAYVRHGGVNLFHGLSGIKDRGLSLFRQFKLYGLLVWEVHRLLNLGIYFLLSLHYYVVHPKDATLRLLEESFSNVHVTYGALCQ